MILVSIGNAETPGIFKNQSGARRTRASASVRDPSKWRRSSGKFYQPWCKIRLITRLLSSAMTSANRGANSRTTSCWRTPVINCGLFWLKAWSSE